MKQVKLVLDRRTETTYFEWEDKRKTILENLKFSAAPDIMYLNDPVDRRLKKFQVHKVIRNGR